MGIIVPFGEWAPDLPDFGNEGATTAKNVIPHARGYKPLNSISAYSTALTAYCRGGFNAVDKEGAVHGYAGDETKLYRLVGTTMTDSSRGAGYSCATDSYWEFEKWGNKCLATNFDDEIQAITLGGSQFADLSGSPPRARHIQVVRDFVVVGNTFDGVDGSVPNRVRWSGFDDETAWAVSATTQADYQDLHGNGGWVQAIANSDGRGVIFQERSIWVMTYIGSPIVFQFDRVEDSRGLYCPRGWANTGGAIFFISDDGFYVYSGGRSLPVGANKVDKTFLNDLNDDFIHRVTAAAIPKDKVIIWSYPSASSVDGTPDKCVLYNWSTQKWSFAEFDHQLIYRAQSIGVTLDGLDSLGYTDIDDSTLPSLDSRVWMGGALQLASFNTDNKLAFFDGAALPGVIETGEFQPAEGMRTEVTEVTPIVDGGTHTAQMGTRETQAGTVSWGSVTAENSSGKCPVRSNSRYHRVRINTTGSFNDAVGVEVNHFSQVGER